MIVVRVNIDANDIMRKKTAKPGRKNNIYYNSMWHLLPTNIE